MKIDFVPLLQLQRDLYDLPPGQARFQAYLDTLLNADGSDAELLPMSAMNPMGKAHVSAMLDALIAIDAEAIAEAAIAATLNQFDDVASTCQLGLVVVDDRMGGWTNRYTSEFSSRFALQTYLQRGWLAVTLWTSEVPSALKVREETLITVYRAAYIQRHGFAQTLQAMLDQAGYAMAMAGCQHPTLDADDMTYTHQVISPHLLTQDDATIMPCLFGDPAAHALGYQPQGLSDRAGFAWALHQARHHYPMGAN
ncbi:MAG: hypothetical protein AAFR26_12350 [Cyanobacteria bacterium J06626_4]